MINLVLFGAAALNCANPQNNAEIGQCEIGDYARARAEMNRQLKVSIDWMRRADRHVESWDKRPSYSAALTAAQRAWLSYRDTHCISVGYQMRGGSGEPSLIVACKTALTQARTKQLRDLLEGQ